MPLDEVTRDFFARPVLQVAPELLGCTVSHAGVTVRLTEVEAYDGSNDPGSHAFRGVTARTRVMFGEPGHLYVYFTYGMHWCANLVCGPSGVASGVLMRAGEVVDGLDLARSRRAGVRDRDLARGPARLAKTLALGRDDNGVDICSPGSAFVVRAPCPGPSTGSSGAPVRTGPRVGISGPGGDAAAHPWRFWLEGEATVSAYRKGVVRRPRTPDERTAR
ncbi:DNA-3-methyladenine glycosylase [Cellulomonas sp. SG140]|uniref:DNA-3-methyladenine glycosylase n=1 Tax=Cellulomonas sp. SG140 TaxID=2976536 RepID=UPI0021E84719|nr:DNA-3-methyladenine glycosylase [Cellulomonas sp. SG140]